jgi:hypothetical protein
MTRQIKAIWQIHKLHLSYSTISDILLDSNHHHHLHKENHKVHHPKREPTIQRIHVLPISDPTTSVQRKRQKHQPLVYTQEDVEWYATLTMFTMGIRGGIHLNNTTNIFK